MKYKELLKITKDKTILYAEDDKEIAEAISEVLKMFFKDLKYVENGQLAVEEYKKERYDLVILDIEMPVMTGLDASQEIKKIDDNQRILFLTAFDDEEYMQEAERLGQAEYMLKPFNEDQFLAKIANIFT